MCGIAGYLNKRGGVDAHIGEILIKMASPLGCRGPDSAGVAIFGPPVPGRFITRVKLGDNGHSPELSNKVSATANAFGATGFAETESYLRFTVPDNLEIAAFLKRIESVASQVEVLSMGHSLEVVKQVGSPENLDRTFHVSGFRGTHGIGHTRLSTESIVDLSHSQPFWGHGYPDFAIVHNGHITNYHQLRRRYEQKGVRFYTENDSEIVAIYLAGRLKKGESLEQAFHSMLADLDGSYSCLAATGHEFGFIRDPFALKPLLFADTSEFVAIANEEIAIREAIPGDYLVRESQAKEVRTWRI